MDPNSEPLKAIYGQPTLAFTRRGIEHMITLIGVNSWRQLRSILGHAADDDRIYGLYIYGTVCQSTSLLHINFDLCLPVAHQASSFLLFPLLQYLTRQYFCLDNIYLSLKFKWFCWQTNRQLETEHDLGGGVNEIFNRKRLLTWITSLVTNYYQVFFIGL